jgi:hypothetical protein
MPALPLALRATLVLAALLLGAARAAQAGPAPPAKPALRKTFTANMSGYSFAPGTGNMTSSNQPIAISEELKSILNVEINPDGRPVRVVFDYHNDSRAGIFSLQPFFDEHVCFIFPPQPVPKQYDPFHIGVEFLWFNQAWDPHVMESYNSSIFNGTDSIAGQRCDRWVWAPGGQCDGATGQPVPPAQDCDVISWCVDRESGGLVSVNRSTVFKDGNRTMNQQLRNVFSGYVPVADQASFAVPGKTGCADMRPISKPSGGGGGGGGSSEQQQPPQQQPGKSLLNDPARLAAINEAADGGWTAAATPAWAGLTADDITLGLQTPLAHTVRKHRSWPGPQTVSPLQALSESLGLPSARHVAERQQLVDRRGGLPAAYDLREKYAQCSSVSAIRNQGACGGCWAFAGAEALADRLCIGGAAAAGAGGGGGATNQFQNLSLSPEYFMDCDGLNAGCGGGLIDDAWKFLASTGLATERCDPYLYCAHPVSPSCETGPVRQAGRQRRPFPFHCLSVCVCACVRTLPLVAVPRP